MICGVHKENGMRPWMKMLAIVGVIGVALEISLATEKTAVRRSTAPAANNQTGRLEFFGRRGTAPEQSDGSVDPTTDLVAEKLAAEALSAPKRFSRSKSGMSVEPASVSSNESKPKSAKADSTTAGSRSAQPETSSTARASVKPVADKVEILAPPESEDTDEAVITRKMVAKKSGSGFQQAGSVASPTAVVESRDEESADGIVAADFRQKSSEKAKVKPARAEQDQVTSTTLRHDSSDVVSASKASRVSVVSDRSPRPIPSAANRSVRSTTIDRSILSKTSPSTATPSVSIEWVKQGEINVGQECACELVVKNSGKVSAHEVVVEAIFPESVQLTQANPKPAKVSDYLEWSIPELAAGEERTIHITMIPSQSGDLETTANVRFTGTAASVFKVAEPLLKVSTEAPAEVIIGDPLVQTVTISNPGTGIAQNVKLQIVTPAGLEATRGDRSQIAIGALNPGESRTVRLSFTAIAGGEQTLEVAASANSGLNQFAEATVKVIAPSLAIVVEGPGLRYAGREARYTLNITNEGQVATNNVHVTHRLPKGFKFLKADKGGVLDANTGSVSWSVGHLEPAQTFQLKLQLEATEIGQFEHQVFASAENGVTAEANTTTTVEGSASLVLEIQDLEDPVEVGQETAYEIRITNNGSKTAQNVGLTFEMPGSVEVLKVQSATQHFTKNGLILFSDLPELAPGKTTLFRVHMRGATEGNLRVRARVASESIEEELIAEELTKFSAK
ncbi:MAG: DUF11 domain-containing protein [Planctomycetes bacterium]|nr:DUF11 domain-containing protein [Planctomycetota bacterium]